MLTLGRWRKLVAFIFAEVTANSNTRVSKTLYEKLINYNKIESEIEHILFRNIISAIDNLENNRPMMKMPGELTVILTGYKHAHFSAATE
jgi:hypothetical protein